MTNRPAEQPEWPAGQQPGGPPAGGDASLPPELGDMARVDELLEALAARPAPLPEGLIDEVEAFINSRQRIRRRWETAFAAAAAIAILAGAWLVWQAIGAAPPPSGPGDGRAGLAGEVAREEFAPDGQAGVGRAAGYGLAADGATTVRVPAGQVTVRTGGDFIAVPVDLRTTRPTSPTGANVVAATARAGNPNVTIFWLYPALGRREAAPQ